MSIQRHLSALIVTACVAGALATPSFAAGMPAGAKKAVTPISRHERSKSTQSKRTKREGKARSARKAKPAPVMNGSAA
jgi:hypothetical protein